MSKVKKFLIILATILISVSIYNYDIVIAKVVKYMPETINLSLAEKFMPDKFWLHRVNSVDRQFEFINKYNGIELDVIYYEKEKAFENSHNKTDLMKYNLEKQFEAYKKINKRKGIWLDFKNLTKENKNEAKAVLDQLLLKYEINKNLVWLESSNWQSLKLFHDDGYKTSYYFPYYELDKMNKNEIKTVRDLTQEIAKSGNVDAISFDGKYYDFINKISIPDRIVYLCWFGGRTWSEVMLLNDLKNIRTDNKVQVILVKDKGDNYR